MKGIINNMKRVKVFLGGPIQYALNQQGDFCEKIKIQLSSLIYTLKKNNIEVFSAHSCESFGRCIPNDYQICTRDYSWMNVCDIFCAFLPSKQLGLIRSDGTCIELGWASSKNKPIILIINQDLLVHESALLRGMRDMFNVRCIDLDHVVNSPESLVNLVQNIAKDNNYGRR